MDDNTGYIITPQNEDVLTHITGIPLETLKANHGWVAHYSEETLSRRWAVIPRSVAVEIPGFKLVRFEHISDPPLPRDPEEISKELQALNRAYFKRRRELEAEYANAISQEKHGL